MKKPALPDRRSALAGESFTYDAKRVRVHGSDGEFAVQQKTPGNDGQWVCITCGLPLANQLEKDTHCQGPAPKTSRMIVVLGEPARHVLAWRSFASGLIEVP